MKIGISPTTLKDNGLLSDVGRNGSIKCKILVDIEHIITGDFCTSQGRDKKEVVWEYVGPEDPIHDLDRKPRFMVILPVLVKEGEAKVVKYLRLPKSCVQKLLSLSKLEGGLQGRIVTIVRQDGSGKEFTSYDFKDYGSRSAVTENQEELVKYVIDNVITGSPEEIREQLKKLGVLLKAPQHFEEEVL